MIDTPRTVEEIADEIVAERKRQIDECGWSVEHDIDHGVLHLARQVVGRLDVIGGFPSSREELVEAAALLIAAIQVMDRA